VIRSKPYMRAGYPEIEEMEDNPLATFVVVCNTCAPIVGYLLV
jgi:hypothetical protein